MLWKMDGALLVGPAGAIAKVFQPEQQDLLCAAPDLLAALKVMVNSYDGLRDNLTSPVVLGKLAASDAAIKKTEGR